eukprot:TRINITY_DN3027_c0_g1_i5.p1 TRINITY_DN3027_c0_g1~~TRINITY_DN3027_c0_g1_i5.p1  ORF type:complete len:821 (-),score=124.84 TRINITY_DN3027_c0_g1_i5:143-2605(-)
MPSVDSHSVDVEEGGSSDADSVRSSRPWYGRVPAVMLLAIGIGGLAFGGVTGTLVTLGATGGFSSIGKDKDKDHGGDGPGQGALPPLPKGAVSLQDVYNKIRTGVVREHDWEVKWRNCPSNNFNQPCATADAPGPKLHGVRSKVITINDQTPGPKVVANLGDTIRIKVRNLMNDAITVHFHGITQFGTPYMDGTPWQNCNIPAGSTFTYEFIAHPAGSAFYHSHVVTQHESGLSGGVIIHDPKDPHKDMIDGSDHLALFKDWWSVPGQNLYYFWQQNSIGGCLTFGNPSMVGGFNPARYWSKAANASTFWAVMGDALLFEGLLVNGKGVYDYSKTQMTAKVNGLTASQQRCPGQFETAPKCEWCYTPGVNGSKKCETSSTNSLCGEPEVFEVEPGKTSKIRLVSDAQLYMLQVCIDHHDMTILRTDMMPVKPWTTKCIILSPGERYDVAVLANQQPGDYMIRFITLEYGAFLESLPFLANCKGSPSENCSVANNVKGTWGNHDPGLPHQAFALLRYKGAPLSVPKGPDYPDYWMSAKTMGCSSDPVRRAPLRCHKITELSGIPETLGSYYPVEARPADYVNAAKLAPTVQFSAQVSFLPDEVPRLQNKALLSRMQIYPESRGFPFMWTDSPTGWQADTPIAFVAPERPTLSLNSKDREAIYLSRNVWREPNLSNAGELYPNYPQGWSRITSGTNAISVKYGDVVRIFMNATLPFGAGAAMPHPMHLHGHKLAVLAVGQWHEPYDPAKLNTENPVYKDVVPIYSDSWMVVQFVASNPGVWFFHCHVNIHLNSGMGMIIDSGGELEDFRKTPTAANMCAAGQ